VRPTLLDLWGRAWDAAHGLDALRGDSAATMFAAEELRRLGSDLSTAPAVAALAERLEARLSHRPVAPESKGEEKG